MQIRLCMNLQGKTGTRMPTARVTLRSQARNAIQKNIENINRTIVKADLHAK